MMERSLRKTQSVVPGEQRLFHVDASEVMVSLDHVFDCLEVDVYCRRRIPIWIVRTRFAESQEQPHVPAQKGIACLSTTYPCYCCCRLM